MYTIKTLDNGVRVVFEELPFLRSVSVGIWVKNGSRYEKPEENGISHFIEHLLFKGTTNRTAKQIASEIDKLGGILNAATAKEYTCYYTKTLDSHFDIALDVLCDMFFNSLFNNSEIEKERNVIFEEINMYEDSADDLSYELLLRNVFKNSPIGQPILGTRDTLKTFNHDTFVEFLNRRYNPTNTIISIAGNIKANEVFDKIQNYFKDFKVSKVDDKTNTNHDYSKSIISKSKDIEQLHLNLGFPGIKSGSDMSYDVSVFNAFLGVGMSSILSQKVREERGLCYSIFSGNSSYIDTGLFSIYSGVNPKNANETIEIIIKELENIKQNLISAELLYETKEQIKSNYILSLESSSNRMQSMGRALTINNKIRTTDEIIESIDNVTMESLEATINKIINIDNLSISAVGNLEGFSLERYK